MTGTIEVPGGFDVTAIQVFVFLNGDESTTFLAQDDYLRGFVVPASNGAFSTTVVFPTEGGVLGCTKKAKTIEVVATGKGLQPKRLVIKPVLGTRKDWTVSVSLPVLTLVALPRPAGDH